MFNIGVGLSVSVKESQQELEAALTNAILRHLKPSFDKLGKRLEREFRLLIRAAIESEPEYQSLVSGSLEEDLRGQLGLDRAQQRVNRIIDVFINNIVQRPIPLYRVGKQIKGEIEIVLLEGDYKDILQDDEATIVPRKSDPFNWVEWLLLRGDEQFIIGYDVLYPGKGRSGLAVMAKGESKKWGVPPQYAGIAENNWLTRAITKASAQIQSKMTQELRATI